MSEGVVGHPYNAAEYIDPDQNYTGSGWSKVFGFLDGVGGVADRLGGITDTAADISQNLTDAKRAPWELRRDKEAFDQQQFLDKLKVKRGDNRVLYLTAAAGAVALVLVLR